MRRHLPAAAAVVLLALLAYGNTLRNGFTWDDHIYITGNPFIQAPGSLLALVHPGYYVGEPFPVRAAARPAFLASLAVDHALWGVKPFGYHLTNVLLHAANAAWLYVLAWTLFGSAPLALGAATLFAVHPGGTESVNAVSFRPDLLAFFFLAPALLLYRKTAHGPAGPSLKALAASAALYWLGLLSKETAAVLPLLALLTERRKGDLGRWRVWGPACAVYLAIFASYWAFHEPRFSYPAIGKATAGSVTSDRGAYDPSAPPWGEFYRGSKTRFLTMSGAFLDYSRWALWPARPTADRAPDVIRSWSSAKAWTGLILLACVVLLGARARGSPAGFGACWFAACLLPAANLYPLYNPVAERYLYVPLAGFCIAAAAALHSMAGRLAAKQGPVYAGALALLLLPAMGRTWTRNRDWRDDGSLWASVPKGARVSPRVHYNRGVLLQRQGRLTEAAREYHRAIRAHPGYVEALVNLGAVHEARGNLKKALGLYRKAANLKPGTPVPYFALGALLERTGQAEYARGRYAQALKADPSFEPARARLERLSLKR